MPFLIDSLVILVYFAIIIGIGLSQRSKSDRGKAGQSGMALN